MIKEIYKEIKNYLTLQIIDVAMKEQVISRNSCSFEQSDYQLVKKRLNKKNSLERSNYNLIKKERR